MAYYNQNSGPSTNALGMNEKKEDEQVPGQPVQLSNGASPMAATNAPVQPNKPASSGMATGFQAYQKANQGAATNKLANAAKSNVQNLGQQATTAIGQATNKFGQKVDAGSLANRQQALQDVSNAVAAARNLTAPPKPVAPVASAQPQVSGGNIAPQAAAPATLPAPMTAVPMIDQAQQDRFKEVINAKYQGPESLRQAGLYNPAAEKVGVANQAIKNAGTAQGREELLRSMYEKRGDYNRGLNKLDTSLLNASQTGVQNLQNTAKDIGNVSSQLDKAQLQSGNLAQNRTQEIKGIRDQAKTTFSEGKKAEEAKTEERLSTVIKDWDKLPEYFKEILRNQDKGAVGLNSFESSVLGVGNGEGLYNMGENAIATAAANKGRLITRDEQARQAALSQLAGLDQSNTLDNGLLYGNADIAGTQTALDALDLEQTRRNFNDAEQSFRDTAENTNLTGEGMKKVSRGNAAGKKTKKYYATVSGNAGDFLENAGYDLDSEVGQGGGQTPADGQKLLQAALERTSAKRQGNANQEDNDKVIGGAAQGAAAGAAVGSAIPVVGTGIGAAIGTGIGAIANAGTADPYQIYSDLLRGMGGPAEAVGKGIQDIRGGAKDVYDDTYGKVFEGVGLGKLGSGIGGMIGGIDSGSMKKFGDAVANDHAVADLKNKYTNFLDGQGFNNRVDVVNNEKTTQRLSGLEALLAQIDKNKG